MDSRNESLSEEPEVENIKEIEFLTEELEQLYKNLEILQKENVLFEKYAVRHGFQADSLVNNIQETELTNEQKYLIAVEEEEYMKE
jgi:hypothetical protein